jgi:hypothetical protein
VEALVEPDLAGLAVVLVNQRPGVVDEQLARRAAEVAPCAFNASQPGTLALVQEHFHVAAPRVAQRGDEQVDLLRLAVELDVQRAEVDLQLLARRGLEAHRGQRLRERLAPQVRDGALDAA